MRITNKGETVRLSGWVNRKRDHGSLLFLDLRDHYGMTQCVIDRSSPLLPALEAVKNESVVTVTGKVVQRPDETANDKLPTGAVEIDIEEFVVQSAADPLPLQVNADVDTGEDIRLKYRFLDLRREAMQKNIKLRCDVIAAIRRRMWEAGFREFQTPILTSSSPEGARDYLVPSRIHPGKFYALPQAPQQFKQLLMIAGYDRYFQIAACFRDEDARADRSPGEFYQLDFEMSYVTQEDVFNTIQPVLFGVFEEFADGRKVYPDFPRIPFDEAMLKYGSDKPDLRNQLLVRAMSRKFSNVRMMNSVPIRRRLMRAALFVPSVRRKFLTSPAASSTSSMIGPRKSARQVLATSPLKAARAKVRSPASSARKRRSNCAS